MVVQSHHKEGNKNKVGVTRVEREKAGMVRQSERRNKAMKKRQEEG